MADEEQLPDEAVVVRCGRPPFEGRPLHVACDEHPSGCYGFSVQAAIGLTVEELSRACFNNSVGYTTAGEIRKMGYDIRITRGAGRHATVVVPRAWTAEAAWRLALLFRPARNPSPKRRA
jgi:hypothetical protein